VIKTDWDLTQFLTRPVSATLVVLTVLVLAYPLLRNLLPGRRKAADGARARS
jgi:putative tricarboxylic transport membrane protein